MLDLSSNLLPYSVVVLSMLKWLTCGAMKHDTAAAESIRALLKAMRPDDNVYASILSR